MSNELPTIARVKLVKSDSTVTYEVEDEAGRKSHKDLEQSFESLTQKVEQIIGAETEEEITVKRAEMANLANSLADPAVQDIKNDIKNNITVQNAVHAVRAENAEEAENAKTADIANALTEAAINSLKDEISTTVVVTKADTATVAESLTDTAKESLKTLKVNEAAKADKLANTLSVGTMKFDGSVPKSIEFKGMKVTEKDNSVTVVPQVNLSGIGGNIVTSINNEENGVRYIQKTLQASNDSGVIVTDSDTNISIGLDSSVAKTVKVEQLEKDLKQQKIDLQNEIKAQVASAVEYLGTIESASSLSSGAGAGDFYRCIKQFTLNNETVHVGDMVIALINNPTVSDWDVAHLEVDSNTWVANSATADGYVTKADGQVGKVWKVDSNGNPGWHSDSNTWRKVNVNGTQKLATGSTLALEINDGTAEGTISVQGVDVKVNGFADVKTIANTGVTAAAAAQSTADEAKADTKKANDAITIINGTGNGSIAKAKTEANTYTDNKITEVNTSISTLTNTVAANKTAGEKYTDDKVAAVNTELGNLASTIATNATTAANATKTVADALASYKTANDAEVAEAKTMASQGISDAAAAHSKANSAYDLAESAKSRADSAYTLADAAPTIDEVNSAIESATQSFVTQVPEYKLDPNTSLTDALGLVFKKDDSATSSFVFKSSDTIGLDVKHNSANNTSEVVFNLLGSSDSDVSGTITSSGTGITAKFNGTKTTLTAKGVSAGSVSSSFSDTTGHTHSIAGSVAANTSTAQAYSITNVGSIPTLSTEAATLTSEVKDGVLVVSIDGSKVTNWNAGSAPTREQFTYATGGHTHDVNITSNNTKVNGDVSSTFTGQEHSTTVEYTPAGSVEITDPKHTHIFVDAN